MKTNAEKHYAWTQRLFEAFKVRYPALEKAATKIEFDEDGIVVVYCSGAYPLMFAGFEKYIAPVESEV